MYALKGNIFLIMSVIIFRNVMKIIYPFCMKHVINLQDGIDEKVDGDVMQI
jgi:hypothetical protein